MPITEKQREDRKRYIGASDMPAIMGVDPYRTRWDVWAEKTGKLETKADTVEAALAGIHFEDGLLDWFSNRVGKLKRNQFRRAIGLPLGAHIDAVVVEENEPANAKTAGLYGPLSAEWGEDGTDEVPDRVIVQEHVEMLCLGECHRAHVPAFLGGRGFQHYVIQRSRYLCEAIAEEACRFWDLVQADEEPPDQPTLAVAKLLKRTPKKVIALPPDLFIDWQTARNVRLSMDKELKALKETEDTLQARILAAMGDAEAADVEGLGRFTYLETQRKGYVVEPTTYRVLRAPKAKAGK